MNKTETNKMITDLRNYAKRLVVDERNDEFLLIMRASFMLEELLKEGTPVIPNGPIWRENNPAWNIPNNNRVPVKYTPTWVPDTNYQYKVTC